MPGVIASAKSKEIPIPGIISTRPPNSAVVAGKAPSSDPITRKCRVGLSVGVRGGARKRNAASSNSSAPSPQRGKSGCSGGNIQGPLGMPKMA